MARKLTPVPFYGCTCLEVGSQAVCRSADILKWPKEPCRIVRRMTVAVGLLLGDRENSATRKMEARMRCSTRDINTSNVVEIEYFIDRQEPQAHVESWSGALAVGAAGHQRLQHHIAAPSYSQQLHLTRAVGLGTQLLVVQAHQHPARCTTSTFNTAAAVWMHHISKSIRCGNTIHRSSKTFDCADVQIAPKTPSNAVLSFHARFVKS
ncbi:hypothetical protein CC86DRAFT_22478 [Ophiobolus disseminans]|uniref:Uncharacterized protein n=1 Tax=Ophiobolus disseminans TaxID=1469910 RepID=A0A6A7A2E2_9PLEO|nr:hypothetical protein CC86DRAFT_22478 [Ophiobolus disseminans]